MGTWIPLLFPSFFHFGLIPAILSFFVSRLPIPPSRWYTEEGKWGFAPFSPGREGSGPALSTRELRDLEECSVKTMIIGIAGGTGSGKTTLTRRLKDTFGDDVSLVYHDNYYRAHHNLTYEERSRLNYDHPDAFETDLMVEHLKKLLAGEPIQCPVYNYSIHDRSEETVEVRPTKVIIIDGILIFADKALRDLMDIKIFVDTDADVRILRRIMRDVKERGRSLDSVVSQYLNTVKPMHEQFVQPSRQYADIVVLEGGCNLVALDMITQRIRSHIEAN